MLPRTLIKKWFTRNNAAKERQQLLERLQQEKLDLEQLLNEAEWEQFCTTEKLSKKQSAKLWIIIRKKIHGKKRHALGISILSVLLIGTCIGFFYFTQRSSRPFTGTPFTVSLPSFIRHVNTGTQNIPVQLPDGTKVTLLPNSEISYVAGFASHARNIHLHGAAIFYVAKDSTKPFTVKSNMLTTTALGTVFRIDAATKAHHIKVHLIEGAVMVKAVEPAPKNSQLPVVLKPGDVLLYDKATTLARVTSATAEKQPTPQDQKASAATLPDGVWYMFNNQPLSEVFDQLAILYDKKIQYHKDDIAGMTFIGKLDHKDPLEQVLEEIARLNNLYIEKRNNQYFIHQKK